MRDHTEVETATAPIVFGSPDSDDESGDSTGSSPERSLPGLAGREVGR